MLDASFAVGTGSLAFDKNGNLYASSLSSGEVSEFSSSGTLIRGNLIYTVSDMSPLAGLKDLQFLSVDAVTPGAGTIQNVSPLASLDDLTYLLSAQPERRRHFEPAGRANHR